MSDQGALFGIKVPPDVKLTEKQWFALEMIATKPVSSSDLGVALHRRRGCSYCQPDRPCAFAAPEGADMGAALRSKGLVRYTRKLGVWYLVESGMPKRRTSAQTDVLPI